MTVRDGTKNWGNPETVKRECHLNLEANFWERSRLLKALGEMLRDTLDRRSLRRQITTGQGPLTGPSVRADFLSYLKRYEVWRG